MSQALCKHMTFVQLLIIFSVAKLICLRHRKSLAVPSPTSPCPNRCYTENLTYALTHRHKAETMTARLQGLVKGHENIIAALNYFTALPSLAVHKRKECTQKVTAPAGLLFLVRRGTIWLEAAKTWSSEWTQRCFCLCRISGKGGKADKKRQKVEERAEVYRNTTTSWLFCFLYPQTSVKNDP